MNYTLLDFDSKLLNVPTAKILPENLSPAEFEAILKELRTQHIQCVYWCAAATEDNQSTAEKFNGILTDHKLTYVCDLDQAEENLPDGVSFYPQQDPDQQLLDLAYESGKYSRFQTDPHLTDAQFKAIYREWMINSTWHRVASDVIVIPDLRGWAGMVTLGEKNKRGDIGLLAVAEHARGKGCGKLLVKSAQSYFKQLGFQQSQVVTQQSNVPACKLYESCGHVIDKLEYFFHFWL